MLRMDDRATPQMDDTVTKVDGTRSGPGGQTVGHGVAAAETAHAKQAAPFALIIDDQEAICRVVAMALTQLGVESAAYQTAKPAIASLDQRRPEIIFLDVALEQSDAIDVIKGLSESRYSGIVQVMSGGRAPLLEAIQRIGARYGLLLPPPLRKPFRRDDIWAVVVDAGLARNAPRESPPSDSP
jgi:DNA-binding NtrC family response regulator